MRGVLEFAALPQDVPLRGKRSTKEETSTMKRLLLLMGLALLSVPSLNAQTEYDHVQVGVFADYFRSNPTSSNMFGVGGRVAVGVVPYVKLEAEMAYDFSHVFREGFDDSTTGSINFQNTGTRIVHGLFGPKLDLGHGHWRPFVEVKGGFINYSFDARDPSFSGFTSQVSNLRDSNISGAVMPGGGLQGAIGPLGLRLDAGDEMFFNHGTHHNLKVMFGPFVRF